MYDREHHLPVGMTVEETRQWGSWAAGSKTLGEIFLDMVRHLPDHMLEEGHSYRIDIKYSPQSWRYQTVKDKSYTAWKVTRHD
jgi:hypothetical protein